MSSTSGLAQRGLEGPRRIFTAGKVLHHSPASSHAGNRAAGHRAEALQHCRREAQLTQASGKGAFKRAIFWVSARKGFDRGALSMLAFLMTRSDRRRSILG